MKIVKSGPRLLDGVEDFQKIEILVGSQAWAQASFLGQEWDIAFDTRH
jgi:hypothetical protein